MSRKKTQAEFLAEIEDKPFVAISKFHGMQKPIRMFCLKCFRPWTTKPGFLLWGGKGCHHCAREAVAVKNRKGNKILEDHGDWLRIDVSTEAIPGATMDIDKADWEFIRQRTKCRVVMTGRPDKRGWYARVKVGDRRVKVHSLLVGKLPHGMCVDHIDPSTRKHINNRRSNIRVCRVGDNAKNRRLANNNTSRATGVRRYAKNGKWVAYINVNRKRIHLGYFTSFDEAVAARKAAEARYFGEFAFGAKNPG